MASPMKRLDMAGSKARRHSRDVFFEEEMRLNMFGSRTGRVSRLGRCTLGFALIAAAPIPSTGAVETGVSLSVDASKAGAKIDRNIFGQFAEHLGNGVYEGVWVGPDSAIPNTRGIRNDVVAALKAIKVPNVRWPGGCFADEYHWRKGIGPAASRAASLNPNWGGVIEPNTFGLHEFMDFVDQIGSEAYLSVNVGSGTPQEGADWLEYMTTAQPTALAKERAANGHPAPYKVPYLGIGNESWDCGGNMSPEYYLSQLKAYSRFVRNFNPAQQQDPNKMLRIAVGPGGDGPRWTEWTETIMKAWQGRSWSWDMEGLSLHNYTVVRWPAAYKSVGFGETEYAEILKATLEMDGIIANHSAIMDKYDPQKKIALVVDEWGSWYAPLPGSNPGFLIQQNSQRDAILAALNLNIFARHADRVRMANIAQMVNVLAGHDHDGQGEDGPDSDLSRLQDVRAVPGRDVRARDVRRLASTPTAASRCRASMPSPPRTRPASCGWPSPTSTPIGRWRSRPASPESRPSRQPGETLTAPKVDSVNTFEAPNTVVPKPISAKVQGGKLTLTLAPKSVTVISVEQ